MVSIKPVLSGLILTSLCLANISGIVTDTSGVILFQGLWLSLKKVGRVQFLGRMGSLPYKGWYCMRDIYSKQFLMMFFILLFCLCAPKEQQKKINPNESLQIDSIFHDKPLEIVAPTETYAAIQLKNEKQFLNQLTGRVTRQNDTSIQIQTENGETLYYNNTIQNPDNGDQLQYIITDYLKNFASIVIQQNTIEESYWHYISLKNGHVETLLSSPIVSPSARFILCYSQGIGEGFVENGLQIYTISTDSIHSIFNFIPSIWGPDSAQWIDDSTISFKRIEISGDSLISTNDTLLFRTNRWEFRHAGDLDLKSIQKEEE